jgi:hypothetical protein
MIRYVLLNAVEKRLRAGGMNNDKTLLPRPGADCHAERFGRDQKAKT